MYTQGEGANPTPYKIKRKKEERKMNAEGTRKITNDYYSERAKAREERSKKFVNKLVNGKIKDRASKGYSFCKAKLPINCSRFIVRDELKEKGFSVSSKATLFSVKFNIQW
jgi:hypothetical protein